MLRAAGAEPVVEWGALFGDVWDLEVARLEREDGDLWLGIGVTKEDRLTHRLVSGDEPGLDAVRSVGDQVRQARVVDDLAHPPNHLTLERSSGTFRLAVALALRRCAEAPEPVSDSG